MILLTVVYIHLPTTHSLTINLISPQILIHCLMCPVQFPLPHPLPVPDALPPACSKPPLVYTRRKNTAPPPPTQPINSPPSAGPHEPVPTALPIALRKGTQTCTAHPISNHAFFCFGFGSANPNLYSLGPTLLKDIYFQGVLKCFFSKSKSQNNFIEAIQTGSKCAKQVYILNY